MTGGLCVKRDFSSPLERVQACGARAIRIPLVHWLDPSEYLGQVRARGWDVLGVLDRDAFSDWGNWRNSAAADFERVRGLVEQGLLQAVAVGNEFDDGWPGPGAPDDPQAYPRGGVSSWVMSFSEMAELVGWAADHLGDRVPLVLGGLSSGQPEALDSLDLSRLSAIQVHPYGKRPSEDWPSPSWGFGWIKWWLDGLQARLAARGLAGQVRLGVGELGINKYQSTPDLCAEWYARMLAYLQERGDLDFGFIFCDGDDNVDGYGLFRADGRPEKASLDAVQDAFSRLSPDSPLILRPGVPSPVPPPAPEPDPPEPPANPANPANPADSGWWDRSFTPEQIGACFAVALGDEALGPVVEANARAYWPGFGPWLEAVGLTDDVPSKIALLATICVETGRFEPIDEYGDYSYFERMYGPGTSAGISLGNIFAGDGARYHGRGFIQLSGRGNYAWMGGELGAPLVDEPDEAKDPYLAAGIMVTFFAAHGIFEQAQVGNWEQVRRRVNGGTNGWARFIEAVNRLVDAAAGGEGPLPEAALPEVLGRVVAEGAAHLGDPYVWDGERPGGFDCSGFVAYCYQTTLGIKLTSYTDAIFDQTDGLPADQKLPGDVVLFEYYDPSQPATRFPHVGLVTDTEGVTLDARGGVGVGYHRYVQGAAVYYRRVRGLSALEDGDLVYKEKWEGALGAIAYLGDDVADELEAERSKLDDYGTPPPPPRKVGGKKPTIAQWQAWSQQMADWAARVKAITDARYAEIGTTGQKLRKTREEFVGPRPTPGG